VTTVGSEKQERARAAIGSLRHGSTVENSSTPADDTWPLMPMPRPRTRVRGMRLALSRSRSAPLHSRKTPSAETARGSKPINFDVRTRPSKSRIPTRAWAPSKSTPAA
jgi:hypothetical protein